MIIIILIIIIMTNAGCSYGSEKTFLVVQQLEIAAKIKEGFNKLVV